MNNRQAKKIVKKYGTTWFFLEVFEIKALRCQRNIVIIPTKWNNKKICYYLKRYYGWMKEVQDLPK